jgi:hypothetical protein
MKRPAALLAIGVALALSTPFWPAQAQTEAARAAAPAEELGASIGYPTVEAALADLHARPEVVFTTQGGWTVATDAALQTVWSFPPSDHPAYPAAVKRQIVQEGGEVSVKMTILCGSTKQACDDLMQSFVQLGDAMRQDLRPRH